MLHYECSWCGDFCIRENVTKIFQNADKFSKPNTTNNFSTSKLWNYCNTVKLISWKKIFGDNTIQCVCPVWHNLSDSIQSIPNIGTSYNTTQYNTKWLSYWWAFNSTRRNIAWMGQKKQTRTVLAFWTKLTHKHIQGYVAILVSRQPYSTLLYSDNNTIHKPAAS